MKRKLASAIAIVALPFALAFTTSARAAIAEELSIGVNHACARTTDGAAYCWGANGQGQLGNGTVATSSQPVAVSGLGTNVARIGAGYQHACAVLTNGTVSCWGRNDLGQLGDGSKVQRNAPVQVPGLSNVAAVSGGTYHTCALLNTGGVKCWGQNSAGQLGDATVQSPRLVPVDTLNLSGAVAIATGIAHTCALLTNGQVKCWGLNSDGQLGNGTLTSSSSPVLVANVNDAVAVVTGQYHTCIKTASGGMKCWGNYNYGQLGNGMTGSTATKVSSPVDVFGLTSGVASIYAPGGGASSCAVLNDGTAKCWGANGVRQLGVGDATNRSYPASVTGLNGVINRFAIGGSSACASTSVDGLVCWGSNNVGQHGAGNTTNVNFPQHVVGF